jgi:hypothetical protein
MFTVRKKYLTNKINTICNEWFTKKLEVIETWNNGAGNI